MDFINEIIAKDQAFFIYLNNLGTPAWDKFWLFITDKRVGIPLYLFLIYAVYKKYNLKVLLITIVCVAIGITCADQLSNLFKNHLFLRLRPCYDEAVYPYTRLVKDTCGGKYGYFSAHGANNFMVATFFSLIFKNKIKYLYIILFLFAALVAYSRIYIGVHYPLDVITGVIVGSLIGFLAYRVWNFMLNRYTKK